MDNGGVLWRDQEHHHLGQGGRGMQCRVLLLLAAARSLCAWFLVLCLCLYARVSFSASIGPVNSNPAAVEVSAKAGLAGLCRLYVDCWAGR